MSHHFWRYFHRLSRWVAHLDFQEFVIIGIIVVVIACLCMRGLASRGRM